MKMFLFMNEWQYAMAILSMQNYIVNRKHESPLQASESMCIFDINIILMY